MSKDIARSKKTTTSIADALAREGCAIVPGGGLAYDAVKALVNHGKSYFQDRSEARLVDFHKEILDGDPGSPEFSEYLHAEFLEQDYYVLLSHLLQDEENEKTPYYARLMRHIILNVVDSDEKRHYIKAVRRLDTADILTIRDIYIRRSFELVNEGNIADQLEKYSAEASDMQKASIATLRRLGLVDQTEKRLEPTSLLVNLAEIIFTPAERAPQAVNRKILDYKDVFIATFVGEDTKRTVASQYLNPSPQDVIENYKSVLNAIKDQVESLGLSVIVSSPKRFTIAQRSCRLLILAIDSNENPMIYYSREKGLFDRRPVIKILLDKKGNTDEPYDTIPTIPSALSLDFTTLDSSRLLTFKDEVSRLLSLAV